MKLTPENVAAIEEFLTRRECGATIQSLGTQLWPHCTLNSRRSQTSAFISGLHALGLDLPNMQGNIANAAELAEFRAWKAAKQANGSAESQP